MALAKTVRTLGAAHSQGKADQLNVVRCLLDEATFAFESRDAVAAALALCQRSSCSFTDCLIAAKYAALGCEFIATSDRRMGKLDGVPLV